ncbi:MAG: hypothetical protein KGI98_02545 [Euryarchaeota archaeon]|nr:hypothetical protein [Euryarchaeota archaeon]
MSTLPGTWWSTLWLWPTSAGPLGQRRCRWCVHGQVSCPSCSGGSPDCYRCSGKGQLVCMVCGGESAV